MRCDLSGAAAGLALLAGQLLWALDGLGLLAETHPAGGAGSVRVADLLAHDGRLCGRGLVLLEERWFLMKLEKGQRTKLSHGECWE